jgi:hypothetical protein
MVLFAPNNRCTMPTLETCVLYIEAQQFGPGRISASAPLETPDRLCAVNVREAILSGKLAGNEGMAALASPPPF